MNMRWRLLLALGVLGACAATEEGETDDVPEALDDDDDLALHREESRNVRPRAYPTGAGYNAVAPGPSLHELAGYRRPSPSPAPRPQQQQQQQQQQLQEELESEEEREEPDRLQQLLQQSKFDCVGKQTGYYADQELQCEVFHYCQDAVKHSWICPDGFTFHQVHLICMPPTHDNICQKSAKYHFVNEYLYRPINQEEADRKPNVALKYSDRYYPADVYYDERREEGNDPRDPGDRRGHREEQEHQQQQQQPPAQVFHAPEDVDIPLPARRPQPNRPYFHF